VLSSQNIFIKSDGIYETADLYQYQMTFLKTQGTCIACIFRNQSVFINVIMFW